jgi:hypothetical protein
MSPHTSREHTFTSRPAREGLQGDSQLELRHMGRSAPEGRPVVLTLPSLTSELLSALLPPSAFDPARSDSVQTVRVWPQKVRHVGLSQNWPLSARD